MSLWKIAWRSIQQRALASALTALSMGLGVALVVAVLVVHSVIDRSFHRGGEGYDLIVGAKGSPLQLVLNSAYYLSEPIENIPYSYYEEFRNGEFAPDIEAAVPVCMGHTYGSYRVVGTTPDMFNTLKYLDGQSYKFAKGENFKWDNPFDAVIGSTVAKKTKLDIGSKFQAIHGVAGRGGHAHEQEFRVVGILEHTGTPNDRALFVNMDGFYQLHAHENHENKTSAEEHPEQPEITEPIHTHADHAEDEHAHSDHEEHADHANHDHLAHANEEHAHADHHEHTHHGKQVTAVLVCVDQNKPGRDRVLSKLINQGTIAQAAVPSYVIADLFEGIIGNIQLVLLIMAVLIVVVAGLGIMVSIYNSMSDRRHEIAVMRALGASRVTVMLVILLESVLLSLGGGLLGLLLGHGLIGLLSPVIAEHTGVVVGTWQFQPIETILVPGLIVLASLVGYLPAMVAYRTDVARSLTASP